MDRNAAITVARALIEEMGIQPGELFPKAEATATTPDIDALLPRRRWVPEMGEKYWYLQDSGAPGLWEWAGGKFDAAQLELGHVFPDLDAAAEHAANIRAWVELRERSNYPDYGRDCVCVYGQGRRILPGVRFASEKSRDAAVSYIGKDRVDALIRWIWRVE